MNYKVKKGDTLSKIAQAHGISLSELMKINGISKEQADKLQVGQSLKIKSQSTLQPKNYPTSSTAVFPRTVWPNIPSTGNTSIPYKDIAAEQQYLRDNAKAIQEQLIEAKYNVGKWGADGVWGNDSQAALNQARKDGYTIQKGQLVKVESKPTVSPKPTPAPKPKVTPQPTVVDSDYRPYTPAHKHGQQCGVDGCAQYANDSLRNYKDANGKALYSWDTTGGDAWTRLSRGSAKMVYSGYDSVDYDRTNYSHAASDKRNFAAADKLFREFNSKTLDPNKTYMVNMFYKGSPARREAWERSEGGTTGTHTGNLYWDSNRQRWRVTHNIHGKVYDDDFISIQGSKGQYGVTAIAEAVPLDNSFIGRAKRFLGFSKAGGLLVPIARDGMSIPGISSIARRRNGDYEYTEASPTGYDLSSIGIHRTHQTQSNYGNSDSLPIAHSLQYVNDRIYDLADRYNLSINEARMLLGNAQAVMWNESGGASSRKVSSRTGEVTNNQAYNAKDNNPLYMLGVRTVNSILGRDTSEGYGRVKVKDLRDLPYYSKQTEQELAGYAKRSPQFSGLSTFASMAQRYHKLQDIFKDDPHLIFGENGTLNKLGNTLLHISHNQGFDNIQQNYNKYKQTGDLNELEQYNNFRYPRLSAQIIDGHSIDGSVPEQLEAAVVVADRK
jgi:murein DD-endopeptidase MepM/ murein hydrolase activator NlpD